MRPDKKAKELLIGQPKKIAIVGFRSFSSFEQFQALDEFILSKISEQDIESVVSGGAKGADILGAEFAVAHSKEIHVHLHDWDIYGKRAGMIRNHNIIKEADVVFAFWDGKSNGTRHSIKLAKELGKKLYIYNF